MPFESVTSFMLDDAQRRALIPEQPEPIKILFYTDDPRGITRGDELFGLSMMTKHLEAHAPVFAKPSLTYVSRIEVRQNAIVINKLTDELLGGFHEVWFFGVHQVNRESASPGLVLRGGRQSELEESEVAALRRWMDRGGGVLMTGDHANPRPADARPGNACPDPAGQDPFLGLGRALGRCVPRAGLMRKWEGAPTARKTDSFNTQSVVAGIDINSTRLESDQVPQRIILQSFDETGQPVAGDGYAHPLFFYKAGMLIEVFPDHSHEGAVITPGNLADKTVWPQSEAEKSVQPLPHVVARGIDKRDSKPLNLLAAYNGDCAGVGRIVAASTWHHFLNLNLLSLPPSSPAGSAADQIGQFYGNLALWLAPRAKRVAMANRMTEWLAGHPMMLEEIGGPVESIGRRAYALLSAVAAPCEVHELLQTTLPEKYRARVETAYFPERGFTLSLFPSKEVLLGSVVESFHQDMIRVETSDAGDVAPMSVTEVQDTGFESAMEEQVRQVNLVAEQKSRIFGD